MHTPLLFLHRFLLAARLRRWAAWLLGLAILLGNHVSVRAQSGIFEGYAVLNVNGAGNTYYDLAPGTTTANPDFTGSLGTFTPGQTLVLSGAQLKTYKNLASDDVTSARLQYRVYLGTGAGSGAFTAINLPFDSNIGGAGPGYQNQQWTNTANATNLLAGLPSGTYTLEVFGEASTTPNGTVYYSNGGANYKATFSVSNPSTALINESFEGGFGTDPTTAFVTVSSSGTNKWFSGTAAGATQGSSAAYISDNTTGTTHNYNVGSASTVHVYREFAVPAGQSILNLSFDWKGQGEGSSDYLRVYLAPASFTPTGGTTTGSLPSGTGVVALSPTLNLTGTYTTATYSANVTPGTSYRLIFSWRNDGSLGTQPPAAIDNVVLTSRAPLLLSGAYTIDNSVATGGRNFQTWAAAVAALNEGLGGAVTFNVAAGQTFNEAPLTVTATGTASNTITFQKSGSAANPVVQGTGGTGTTDAVITLSGTDYVTFTGIDLKDNATNTTATTKMERGLWLSAPGATDGCQFVTYQGGTITLDKTNANSPTGIYAFSSATAAGGANSNLSVLNSTIQNALRGIQLNGSGSALDQNVALTGNTITNLAPTSTTAAVGIDFNAQNALTINNNTISSLTAAVSTAPLYGLSNLTTASTNLTISGNTITGLSSALAGNSFGVVGITCSVASTGTISNNTITQLTCSATGTTIYGIASSSSTSRFNVFDNKINNLTLTSTASNTAALEGIDVATPSGQTVGIYRNYIHTLVHSGSSTNTVYGIRLQNGSSAASTTCNIYNNLIANLRADASSGSPGVRGIAVSTGNVVNVYYNSVYLTGTATAASHQSAALNATTGMTSFDFRNNLLVNKYVLASGATASSRAVAFYRTSTTVTTLATASNNNLLYGTTALYYDGTNSATTLAQYRLAVNGGTVSTPRESAAVTESTTAFVSATDPHLVVGSTTQAEGGAQPLTGGAQSGVADDYDQAPRSATTPDIGADEGAFVPLDLTPPAIAIGTPLPNTTSTTAPTLTTVTISDASGVNVTAGTAPRLYYKLSTDANAYNDNTSATPGFKYVEASGAASPFDFTLDYGKLPGNVGGALPAGVTIQYFVVAQDLATTPNVGINTPNTFAAAPAGVALTSAAFPIGGTLLSYSIQPSFSGTISVGPGQPYTSLTAAGGLFQALNNGVLTGNLTVLITGNLGTEDGTNVLNPLTSQSGGPYTVTVQPDAATERLITGAAGSMGVNGITLNGADGVTFDGRYNGSGRYLRFRNTAATGPTFNLIQDATGNTLRDLYVEGATTSGSNAVITFGNSQTTAVFNGVTAGATGNDNNSVLNCDVLNATGGAAKPSYAFYSSVPSVSAASNSGNTLQGNNLYNWDAYGIFTASGTGSSWTISGNSLYQTATSTNTSQTPLNLAAASSATGWVVSGNYLGGSAPQAGGAAWVNSAGVTFRGIYLNGLGTATAVAGTLVQNNVIANIQLTAAASTFAGIEVKNDGTSYQITGNTIDNISGAGSNSSGTGSPVVTGIVTASTASSSVNGTAQLISGNTISRLASTATGIGNLWVAGIFVKTSASANGLVSRNRIFGFTSAGTTGAAAGPIGIEVTNGDWSFVNNQIAFLNASATGANIRMYGILDNTTTLRTETYYYNAVVLGGTSSTGTQKTYAFQRSVGDNVTLRNNIFLNLRTGGTGGNFAVGINAAGSFSANSNDLYSADAAKLGEVGSTAYPFAGWQTAAGTQDQNSKNLPAKFVDADAGNLNLDPTTNCQLDNAGVAISGVDGEFDNATTSRQTTPDIGADEFSYAQQLAAFGGPATQPVCTGGSGTLTVTSAGNGGLFTVVYSNGTTQTTVNNATAGQTITVPLVGSSTTYTLVSVTDSYGCALGVSGSANTVTLSETTTTTWTGTASTDWANSANWTNCVPAAGIDAVVPTVASGNYPSLSTGAAAVRTITFADNGKLTMSGGTLSVGGNWLRTGTGASTALSGGTVAFVGSGAQLLTDAAASFFNLTVNKADTLRTTTDVAVTGTLALNAGILKTYSATTAYQINLTGTLTETATSFVLGSVATGATLGTDGASSAFAGVGLTLTAHGDGTTTALPGAVTVLRRTGQPVYDANGNTSIRRQYLVQAATNANLNVDLVFGYNDAAYELHGLGENDLVLFGATALNGPWGQLPVSSRDASANTVTLNALTQLVNFTLGSQLAPLPVSLVAFEAKRQGADALLTWTTAQEKNSRGYEVQISADGRSYRPVGFVASETPDASTARHYRFVDRAAGQQGLRYYRLRQLDLNGDEAYFGPRTVQFGEALAAALSAHPNPFEQQLWLRVTAPAAQPATAVRFYDASGRLVLTRTVDVPAGTTELLLDGLGTLPGGVYSAQLTLGGVPQRLKLVKP